MNRKPSSFIWWGAACLTLAGLLAFFLISNRQRPSPGFIVNTTNSPIPLVLIGADGQANIQGVTLSDTNLRDAAFRLLAASGQGDGLRIGPHTPTNDQQLSNLVSTLNAAINAGLIRPNTNKNILPSPYE